MYSNFKGSRLDKFFIYRARGREFSSSNFKAVVASGLQLMVRIVMNFVMFP